MAKRHLKDRLAELCRERRPPIEGPAELGRFLGVSRQTASSWLNGDREPNPDNVYMMADRFNVSARWLWLEQGPRDNVLGLDNESGDMLHYFSGLTDKSQRNALIEIAKQFYSQQQKSTASGQ